jgi:hypothetical protein
MKIEHIIFALLLVSENVLSYQGRRNYFLKRNTNIFLTTDEGLCIFGEITKDIGNLGAVVPFATAVFYFNRQEKTFEKDIKAISESLSKEIKASNDLLMKDIKYTNDLLSKDIKANADAIKELKEIIRGNMVRIRHLNFSNCNINCNLNIYIIGWNCMWNLTNYN